MHSQETRQAAMDALKSNVLEALDWTSLYEQGPDIRIRGSVEMWECVAEELGWIGKEKQDPSSLPGA